MAKFKFKTPTSYNYTPKDSEDWDFCSEDNSTIELSIDESLSIIDDRKIRKIVLNIK